MRIAISSNVFAQYPRRKALELARGLGFRYMDIWASPVFVNHLDPKNEAPETVRKELEEYGVEPIGTSIYYTTYEEKLQMFRYAAAVGIPYITFAIAPLANYLEKMSNLNIEGRTLTEPGAGWEAFTSTMQRLLDEAEKAGVRIALQVPHVYTLIERLDEFYRLLEDIKHPALYFALSPTHTVARGSNLREFIEACGERLAIFHLWNVKPDYEAARDDRGWGTPSEQMALKGYFDFTEIIDTWQDADSPVLCLKCHGTEGWTDLDKVLAVTREAAERLPLRSI